jgi:PucR C-terminal helix-turn-helix domain/GGDEF-like domain
MAEVDSTEQRARLGARERFDRLTHAGTKPRGAARPLELIASAPGDQAARYGIEQLVDSADSLGPLRIELARWLRSREEEFQEAVFAHLRSVAPDAISDGDSHLALGLREMIAACVDCGLSSIEQGAPWSGPMPPAVAAQASRAASGGVSLTTALCRCVAGHTLAWSFVLNEVAHHDLPDEQRFALLLQASAVLGSLLARVQAEVASAHSSEIKRRARSHEQRRAEIVQKLLAGESPDDSERAELGYELDAWHLAVIATGADAEKAVRFLAATLGRDLLPVPQNAETVWAWLGGKHKTVFADIDRVWSKPGVTDVSLAVGEAGRGVEGWRVTHGEAQGALLVARERPRRLTRYLDVALDATALQDEALADSLIERYLSPLDDLRTGGEAARRTLRALFDAEHNVSSAAHPLKVHRSTVHRQRNEIERRLGCRLHEHQAEIEVALRIEELRSIATRQAPALGTG